MLEFLSDNLKYGVRNLNLNLLYEIRARSGQPTLINYDGNYQFLGKNGLVASNSQSIICTQKEIEDMVYSAGNFSIYAVEDQIRRGFITANHGERLGLAGEYVYEKGQPLTLKSIRSICIRVPHEIKGCAQEVFNQCLSDEPRNLLIISPPGQGKTTILRDLSRILSENTHKNILICDERGEISVGNIGTTCDVIVFAEKKVAFEAGIRAMRPDIMITDEIMSDDIGPIKKAIFGGVIVIASAHLRSFSEILEAKMDIFDRYAILDREKIGKLLEVYDKNGNRIYKYGD